MDGFEIQDLIEYLEKTDPDSWLLNHVRRGDKNCVMGHIFNFGGGDENHGGSHAWDFFEEVWATTYMIYPVNDGQNPKYQQPTAKERVIAYLKDLRDGKEKTTQELWKEMETAPTPN